MRKLFPKPTATSGLLKVTVLSGSSTRCFYNPFTTIYTILDASQAAPAIFQLLNAPGGAPPSCAPQIDRPLGYMDVKSFRAYAGKEIR
jgi:hypothetical protein